jgi:signal transduction histidine kinase
MGKHEISSPEDERQASDIPPTRHTDLHSAAFEQAADAILVYNRQGRIMEANGQVALLTACPHAELPGMSLDAFQFNPPPPFPPDTLRWEGTLQTRDARTLPVEISRAALDGRYAGLAVLVIRDITAHVAVLQHYERMVTELDDFAHIVAHDLQNPLNNIKHSVDMLRDNPGNYSPEVLESINGVAIRSTHKALAIVDELLLLAGVRQDQDVPIMALDMGLVVSEVIDRLHYVIEDHEATVILPDEWPSAQGYGPWVEEVWANYMSNALKYGGHPPVLRLGAQAGPGGMVRFWVEDNGPGVPQEEQSRLFVPFSRLEHVRAQGYGLGLSIVDRIISRLGGRVGFQNAPEGGAVFSFTLPANPTPGDQVLRTLPVRK